MNGPENAGPAPGTNVNVAMPSFFKDATTSAAVIDGNLKDLVFRIKKLLLGEPTLRLVSSTSVKAEI